MTVWTEMESPVGVVRVVGDGDAVTSLMFDPVEPAVGDRDDINPVLAQARMQLQAYFDGELKEFDLPLAAAGTPFQQRVWKVLSEVGYGETVTYGEIARRLGLPPGASRAVGMANGRNPIAIVVPCHRVVGSNGKLIGYAGGLDRKQKLLSLESAALF
jgi:methylated-DNA-[protein]-cysteine S-methyltransferase